MDTIQPTDQPGKPLAIDLSHHLSLLATSRVPSPLKGMYKYFTRPGILMLAGGLPPPAYFPFETISCSTLKSNSFKTTQQPSYVQSVWNWIKGIETDEWKIEKYDSRDPSDRTKIQLSTALQYGTAQGLPALAQFIYDFVTKVYQPAYSDYRTVINAGSTDAWGKIVTTLCESGDGVLCEEWTYPSALALSCSQISLHDEKVERLMDQSVCMCSTAWPNGFKPVPLPIDGEGLTVEGMKDLLETWDPSQHDGMRRPRILYTVPVCQNPTGVTMTLARKRQIYELAVKYDVIIVEDDPYYFLQAPPYSPPSIRSTELKNCSKRSESDEEFLKSLIPSYLGVDYQGRVIRIDTFSKTICPGSRLGFTVASPIIAERLEKANESSTQSASGFSQALVGKLLCEEWGFTGYLRWLKGIKAQYRDRRDLMVDLLVENCSAGLDARQLSSENENERVWGIFMRDQGSLMSQEKGGSEAVGGKKILSFVAPQGGMFIWLRIHFASHPSFHLLPVSKLLESLWEDLAEHNVLVAPGSMFSGREFPPKLPTQEFDDLDFSASVEPESGDGFFRIAFSTASQEQMKEATRIIGKRVEKFFRE